VGAVRLLQGGVLMSSERRTERRQSLERLCWLDTGPSQPPLACRLINVSKSGARVDCKNSEGLPDQLILYLTQDGKVGRKCRVMRRNDVEVGLRFTSQRVPAPSGTLSRDHSANADGTTVFPARPVDAREGCERD
jgi:hypothetical protein